MFKKIFLSLLLFFSLNITINQTHAETIKNMTKIIDIKETHLIGYGLVVGLNGTGDYNIKTNFCIKSLNNMLSKLNINTVSNKNIKIRNIASVIVTAKLPKYYNYGDKIDATVSSIGNATNIDKGILLMTVLKDNDNNVYAIAQGKINIKKEKKKKTSNGIIHKGVIIEKKNRTKNKKQTLIHLKINEENYTLCQKIIDIINLYYPNIALPINSNTIQLKINQEKKSKFRIISNIQNINIPVFNEISKVIINSKNGTIIIKGLIKVDECSIIDGKIFLKISKNKNKNKKIVSKKIKEQKNIINSNQNLESIILNMQKKGIKNSKIISIIKLIKKSGFLHSKLIILNNN